MQQYVWTKAGPARVSEEEENRIKILLPGRKRGQWISKTQVEQPPAHVVLTKQVNFDMDCGCTAVVELTPTEIVHYNIYGSLKKYLASETKAPSELSHHLQRKHLGENGFTRSRSKAPRAIQDPAMEGYRLLIKKVKSKKGKEATSYKLVTA